MGIHGGKMWVTGITDEKGYAFTISLPMIKKENIR
jgi:hypothetical protein